MAKAIEKVRMRLSEIPLDSLIHAQREMNYAMQFHGVSSNMEQSQYVLSDSVILPSSRSPVFHRNHWNTLRNSKL